MGKFSAFSLLSSTVNTLVQLAWLFVGGLSKPSKMPGYGYSIPARHCKMGGRLRSVPGSVCEGCYAMKNRYIHKTVDAALERRFLSLNKRGWVEAMSLLVEHHCGDGLIPAWIRGTRRDRVRLPFFRWHDAGDLQSIEHLDNIAQVARNTPTVAHWLPTRERAIVKAWLDQGNHLPANLLIRISATMIDGDTPDIGLTTSTVSRDERPKGAFICPAPKQGGKCGECRACWNPAVERVDYHLH